MTSWIVSSDSVCCAAAVRTKWPWYFPLASRAQAWSTAHLWNLLMEMLKLLGKQWYNLRCLMTVLLIKYCRSLWQIRAFTPCILFLKSTDSFRQQDLQAVVRDSNSSRSWLARNADMSSSLPPLFQFSLFSNASCRWCLMMFNYCLLILSGSFLGLVQTFLIQLFNIGSWLIRILKIL